MNPKMKAKKQTKNKGWEGETKKWIKVKNGRAYLHSKGEANGFAYEGVTPLGNDLEYIEAISRELLK